MSSARSPAGTQDLSGCREGAVGASGADGQLTALDLRELFSSILRLV